jgi:hypothetical protein
MDASRPTFQDSDDTLADIENVGRSGAEVFVFYARERVRLVGCAQRDGLHRAETLVGDRREGLDDRRACARLGSNGSPIWKAHRCGVQADKVHIQVSAGGLSVVCG